MAWLAVRGRAHDNPLTIGDLLDLGFDPTRLKEFNLGGEVFIFERIQVRLLPELERNKTLLERLTRKVHGLRVRHAQVRTNPPLLVIRDGGNAYVLRRKVAGIHWEEALEQLQSYPALQRLNDTTKVDRLIVATIRQVRDLVAAELAAEERASVELLTYFVSWDVPMNQPKLMIDLGGTFLESVWLA